MSVENVRRVYNLCWFMKTYADDEVFGGDEVVVEDGIEDGRAELACGAGEG
jgi:hypothetical protein